jgi:hypothetical protein
MHIDPERHIEPRKIGHKWFDAGITIAILIVSVSSLVVAVVHSRTLERMADANARLVEANSWPFLSYNTDKGASIGMSIVNDGVGPAKIETIEVKWAGRAKRNAVDFLKACCGFTPKTADLEYELIAGRVLRAGQSINILKLPHTRADDAAWNALNRARIAHELSVNVCYCSVFDQCWWEDIVRFSLKPRPVDRCTARAVAYGIPER